MRFGSDCETLGFFRFAPPFFLLAVVGSSSSLASTSTGFCALTCKQLHDQSEESPDEIKGESQREKITDEDSETDEACPSANTASTHLTITYLDSEFSHCLQNIERWAS